jgi:hypothetical protein
MAIAKEINDRGVLLHDYQPRNILIATFKQEPPRVYFVDFGHVGFKADYKNTNDPMTRMGGSITAE